MSDEARETDAGRNEDAAEERHPDDLLKLRDADEGVYLPPTDGAGELVVRADLIGTAVFAVTAVLAAVFFTGTWQWIAAITVLVLFAAGIFAFLWAYYNAVQRSRTEEITVTQLYLLLGPAIPSRIRRIMLGALAVQLAVAIGTAFARLDGPDGKPGSSLALGFLIPMFGFGLNGLWAAYHGRFDPRAKRAPVPSPADRPARDEHGADPRESRHQPTGERDRATQVATEPAESESDDDRVPE